MSKGASIQPIGFAAGLEFCAVCGGRLCLGLSAVKDPQTGERFSILSCATCGLGHTSPVPKAPGSYYGPDYHGKRHGMIESYCLWWRIRTVKRWAAGHVHGNLLDIGCGDGAFMLKAKSKGYKVYGTELFAEHARKIGLCVTSSLAEIARYGPFDIITAWHSLEHFVNPLETMRQAIQLLKPEGTLILSVPNWGGLQSKTFGGYWFHLDVPRHLYHFTRHAIKKLLERMDLSLVNERHHELEYDLAGWIQSLLNVLDRKNPNYLFNILSKRPGVHLEWKAAMHLALAGIASFPAFGLVCLGSAMHSGGTLVVAVRQKKFTGKP